MKSTYLVTWSVNVDDIRCKFAVLSDSTTVTGGCCSHCVCHCLVCPCSTEDSV